MPRIVNHEKRRAMLAEALWRLVGNEGIRAVSIRKVAAEAGHNRGTVEHYFPTVDSMLLYASRHACEKAIAQVRYHHRELSGRAALEAILTRDMALYGNRRTAARIWFGLLATAVANPLIADEFVRFDDEMGAILTEIIGDMQTRSEASAAIDAEADAGRLLAFNLALNLNVVMRPDRYGPEVVEREIDEALDRLKGT